MLITEVTSHQEVALQTHDWKSPREVAGWLRKKGFGLKGSGKFGAVFAKPGYDRLVKISRRDDECWLRFAHWTLGMKTNPAVPYIDWVHTYKDEAGTEFFIAVIERLSPFNRSAIMKTRDLPGLAYLYAYVPWYTDNGDPTVEAIEDRLIKEGIAKEDDTEQQIRNAAKRYLKSAKGGRLFINALLTAEKKATGKCDYDIHSGNIMYRPADGRLVVIDPLADLSELGASYQV